MSIKLTIMGGPFVCGWWEGACLAGGFPGPVGEGPHPYWKTTKLCFLDITSFFDDKIY